MKPLNEVFATTAASAAVLLGSHSKSKLVTVYPCQLFMCETTMFVLHSLYHTACTVQLMDAAASCCLLHTPALPQGSTGLYYAVYTALYCAPPPSGFLPLSATPS